MSINKVQLKNGNVLLDVSDVETNTDNVLQGVTFIDNGGNKSTGAYVPTQLTSTSETITENTVTRLTPPSGQAFNEVVITTNVSGGGGDSKFHDLIAKSITSVSASDVAGIEAIGSYTFASCQSLTTFNSNDALLLGGNAFNGCYSLTNVSVPNVTNVGPLCFYGCGTLETISLPSIVSIDDEAFRFTSLNNINLGQSLEYIGGAVFRGLSTLTHIELPSTLTSIGKRAFRDCSNLQSVIIYATTPPTLDTDVFTGCSQNLTIAVPAESVSAYQSDASWSTYASQIVAIQ